MKGYIFLILLILSSCLFYSCGKKTVDRTKYYTYELHTGYAGIHPTTNVNSGLYLIDKDDQIEFQVSLNGAVDSNIYRVQIYAKDSTASFGYADTPILDLGSIINVGPFTKSISSISFTEFTENFKGYVVIRDPYNSQKDTSSLLIFGKIGSEW